jgi:hypothetical protein
MGSSYGERRQPPTSKSSKDFKPKLSESSRRTMVHPECNDTPRPKCLCRQANSADLQHHLPPSDSTAPQWADTSTDPRTLIPSEAQVKAPAGPANYRLVNLQRTPVDITSLQWHKDTDWILIGDMSLDRFPACYWHYRHHCCWMSCRQIVAFWERNKTK